MSSRDRVLAACRHEEPDRVPVDFGGHRSSGIAAIAYAKLKNMLGITEGDVYVYDMVQQLAVIETPVLEAVGADVVELGRAFLVESREWTDWELPDGTPCKIPAYLNLERKDDGWYLLSDDGIPLAVQKEDCLYFEQIHWPWLEDDPAEQEFDDLEEALSHSMWSAIPTPGGHIPLDDYGMVVLSEAAAALRSSTDRAIIGLFGGSLFETAQCLYRNDRYFMHLATSPDACEALSARLCSLHLQKLERWLKSVGPHIDIILFGDDFGGQNGPLISPAAYRRVFKPWEAQMWQKTRELAPHAIILLHSCGGIEPLIDDFIDIGLDAANPVQISSKGMDPETLKKVYGDRFVFWGGGCDTRRVLPLGTPAEVRRHVHELLDIWTPGGGYVFQQVHNVLADVPPENVLAMFSAVKNYC